MPPTPEMLSAQIDDVCNSLTFAKAPRSRRLLKYLGDCTLKGTEPSEKEIAIDVFDRLEGFDASAQSIVRVSVIKLRGLIDRYLRTEGVEDPVQLTLPRNSYAIAANYAPADGASSSQVVTDMHRAYGELVVTQRDYESPEGIYKALLDEQGFLHLPQVFLEWLAPMRADRFFVTSLDHTLVSIYWMADWHRHREFLRSQDTALAASVYLDSQQLGREARLDDQGRIFIHDEIRHELELDFEVVRIASEFRWIVFCKESVYLDRERLP